MHGLNLAFGLAGPDTRCSPQRFFVLHASKLQIQPASYSDRNQHHSTAFCYPAATHRFRIAAAGSNAPGLHFRYLAEPDFAPFDSPLPLRLLLVTVEINVENPLTLRCPTIVATPRTSAPLQGFGPFRIVAPGPIPATKLTLAECPISSRSPSAPFLSEASRSPFKARYIPPGFAVP